MPDNSKYVVNYLKKLLKIFFLYIGVLPWLYGAAEAYLPFLRLPELPLYISFLILLLTVALAGYLVWKQERLEVEKFAELSKPRFKIRTTQENIPSIKADIKKAEKMIAELRASLMTMPSLGMISSTVQAVRNKITQLEKFIELAEDFEAETKDVAKVTFLIKNCSENYDEKINIVAVVNGEGKIIMNSYYIEHPPELPSPILTPLPTKDRSEILMRAYPQNGEPFRSYEQREDGFNVTLKYLQGGEEATVLWFYVKKPLDMDLEIVSVNSKRSFYKSRVE